MNCANCHTANPAGARFCVECGTPFPTRCEACQSELPPHAKFCPACGTARGRPAASPPPASEIAQVPAAPTAEIETLAASASIPQGERRQLTVMFCDMVGFTALASRLDPEILQGVVRQYEDTCAAAVTRFGGYVYQRLGDGVVAFFGYPLAHEAEAERAIHAARDIIGALKAVEFPDAGHLQVRIGIAAGLVVVGADQGAVGETMNLAARLQTAAQPDEVIVSESVRRMAGGAFEFDDLGPRALKGISGPVGTHRVRGIGMATSRFEAATRAGLTPLVGREHEIALLLERWQLALDGEGQVVLLSGEPGIGKSRIASGLSARLVDQDINTLHVQCSPYHVDSAFHPLIECFERQLKAGQERSAGGSRAEALRALLVGTYGGNPDDVRFIAGMLSIPYAVADSEVAMTPQKLREETIRAVVDVLLAAARRQPLFVLFEDAHWADPSSLQLLEQLIARGRAYRMLMVLTHRPEFQSSWPRHGHVTSLSLSKLTRAQSRAIVAKLTRAKALPAELLERILSRTDGIPLFVEELTRGILESGELNETSDRFEYVANAQAISIPETLRDSLVARLDRLGDAREVAQLGAVLGREFSYGLLRAVSTRTEEELVSALQRLLEAEVLYQQGALPEALFVFKHALVQDTAYELLLKGTRQQFHLRIAQVLENRFSGLASAQPELLAYHFTAANLVDQGLEYWLRAGRQAMERSAHHEAIQHLTKARALVGALPESVSRSRHELDIEVAIAAPLIASRGYAAPEVVQAYERARQLCDQLGDTQHVFTVLRGLWVFFIVRCQLETARELGTQLLTIATASDDPAQLVEAHHAMGQTLFHLGEFAAARDHCEQGLRHYVPDEHQSHVFLYGTDPGIACLFWSALSLWFMGYPDQALARSREGLALARRSRHPLALSYGFQSVASIHQYRGEAEEAERAAMETITLTAEQQLPFWHGFGVFVHGWARAARGEPAAGIADMRSGIDIWEATDARAFRSFFLVPLAEAYLNSGQFESGLEVLAQAEQAFRDFGEAILDAEIHRLRGEFLRAGIDPGVQTSRVERCFQQALDVARRQRATSLELRTVMSLACLWRDQGRTRDADEMLGATLAKFTEGFDTADLRRATALREDIRAAGAG